MAQVMDKVTLIRSMHHTMKNHNSAGYYALTGHAPLTDDRWLRDSLDLFPGYASLVDKLAPSPAGGAMPTAVSYPHVISDGSVTPGQHASFLGKKTTRCSCSKIRMRRRFHCRNSACPKASPLSKCRRGANCRNSWTRRRA